MFSGIGGFDYAAEQLGIKVAWQSEIDPWACRVLEKRFPNVEQLGDVCNIDGAKVTPVDIITAGSPCQDFSVAGKRAGLIGSRSGLFMESIRIINEMRRNTNGLYPKYVLWENVPGMLSSKQGEDFREMLSEITETHIPASGNGGGCRWAGAGMVIGESGDTAWRILDAKFLGVPQQRRRVFVVRDFGRKRAGEILFEHDGLQRNTSQSKCPSQKNSQNSLRSPYKTEQRIIPIENYPMNSRIKINDNGVSQTLTSRMGTGGGNVPLCLSLGTSDFKKEIDGGKHVSIASFYSQMKAESMSLRTDDKSNTLVNSTCPGHYNNVIQKNIIRRYTPAECLRLQGFPDEWFDGVEDEKGKPMPDTAKYKACGNTVATVCVKYILNNILKIEER